MNMKYYNKRKLQGICTVCGKDEAMINSFLCPECSYKQSIYDKNYRKKIIESPELAEKYRAHRRQYLNEQYHRCKKLGICVQCKKRRAKKDRTLCIDCAIKANRRSRKEIPRSERISFGLCYFCGNPQKDGYGVCEKHYVLCNEKLDRTRSSFNTKNHLWNIDNNILFTKIRKKEESSYLCT